MLYQRFFLLSIVLFSCSMLAQDLRVAKMIAVNDIQAMTRRRDDMNGNACALVKVQFPKSNCSFEGNIVGDISYKTNEYWIYMNDDSEELTIEHEGIKPLNVKFQDYGIGNVESKVTYELTIYEEQKDAPTIYNEGLIALSENNLLKAYYCFIQAANNNYPQAYVALGKMYVDFSSDIPSYQTEDCKRAYYLFKKGVQAGLLEAKYLLGRLLLEWQYLHNSSSVNTSPLALLKLDSETEKSSDYAWALIKEAATAGIEDAQWMMVLDKQWSNMAASNGSPIAAAIKGLEGLFRIYPIKNTIKKGLKRHIPDYIFSQWYNEDSESSDYMESLRWLEKSAEKNVFIAQYVLSIAQDKLEKRMYWLKEAAKHNNYDVQIELVSNSAPEDRVSILKRMLEHNSLNKKQICYVYSQLGSAYLERKMYEEAFYWLKMSNDFDFKSPYTHYLLGKMYYEGFGTSIDYSMAFDHFKQVIEEGETSFDFIQDNYVEVFNNPWASKAKTILGIMLRDGKGVPVDIKQSLKYFLSASSGPSEKIETQMAKCAIGTYFFDRKDFDKAYSYFRHSIYEFDLVVKGVEWYDIIDTLTFAKACYAQGMINWHNRSSVYDRQFAMDFYFKQSAELGYADAINIIKTGLVTPINSIPPLFNATNNNLSEANSSYYRGASLSAQNAGENQGQSVVKGSEYSIVTTPDIQPSFKGGEGELMGYLAANLKYPIISQENGEQGLVIVSAIVNVDGSLSGVKVEKSVSPSLDKEAKRLVSKMPVWNPGMVNNEPVRTKCLIPVSFRLTN